MGVLAGTRLVHDFRRTGDEGHAVANETKDAALLALLPVAPLCPVWPPPMPWMAGRPTREEEVEDLKEHIEMLKEELKAAEEELKELESLNIW